MMQRLLRALAVSLLAGCPGAVLAQSFAATHDTLEVTLADGSMGTIHHFEYVDPSANPAERPVTFVWNGGPGAASIYLHMLAIGPQVVEVPGDGSFPRMPSRLVDNPHAWTAFTDLVFYDPVGTGQSRAVPGPDGEPGDPTRFWTYDGDMEALARFIHAWLTQNDRWASPKVIVGESYGGLRVIEQTYLLMTEYDVALDKAILISPSNGNDLLAVDSRHGVLAPALLLPTYAATAAALGKNDLTITSADARQVGLEEVEAFALGEYITGLATTGRMSAEALDRFYGRVAGLIGLDPALVRAHRGRIPPDLYAREIMRAEGQIVDRYDMSRVYADPEVDREAPSNLDPSLYTLNSRIAPPVFGYLQEAFDLDLTERYEMLSWETILSWNRADPAPGQMATLGTALTLNTDLEVLVVHGLYDAITPYFETRYLLEQSILGDDARDRAFFGVYPGGHMFYLYAESRAEFFADVQAFMAR